MHTNPLINSGRRARLVKGLGPWMAGNAPTMALAHLVLESCFNFLPVLYVLLIPKLELTYAQIGTLVLLTSIAGSLTQPIFGWLSDRSDPRVIVIASIIWGGILMGLVGFMPTYGTLAALLVLASLGSAAFHPPAAALSAQADVSNRGRAMSIFSVGGNLGGAMSPALVGLALGAFGIAATAVVIPLALATGLYLARQMPRIHPVERSQPADTDGRSRFPTGSLAALLAMVAVVAARSYYQKALITYLPEWLRTDGQTLAMAGAALAALLVAVSIGSLFGGSLSDRFGRLPVIVASLILMMAGHWLLMRLGGASQMATVVLVGLSIGASFPVTIVLAQEAWPRSVGFASAMVMGLGWLPAGLGALVVGRIADRSSLSQGLDSLLFVPLAGLAAAAIYWLIRNALQNQSPARLEAHGD
jgi:FSR family fosmidomycin resistance protein-like MFS transporter